MSVKDCKIVLDNYCNCYYPGQIINGYVEYIFNCVNKARGIKVEIKGEAETIWSEKDEEIDEFGNIKKGWMFKTGEEEYFSIQMYVLGSESGNELEIPAGTHKYPFTCTLPPTLPSSFEGDFGFVRYTIMVTLVSLDSPQKFSQWTKMAFSVVSLLDLNLNAEYKKPLNIHIKKTFCCGWCKSRPVHLDVDIPVSGFCSGQNIPLDITCENGTSVDIENVNINLEKISTYHCTSPTSATKKCSVIINKLEVGSVPANSTRIFNKFLQIPPLPPSNLDYCSIIDLVYCLNVIMCPSGIHLEKEASKNIIIGTIPLHGLTQIYSLSKPAEATSLISPSAPPETPDITNFSRLFLQSSYANSAPPYPPNPMSNKMTYSPAANPWYSQTGGDPNTAALTFQESQFGTTSIKSKGDSPQVMYQGNTYFAPMYPVYSSSLLLK